MSLLNIASLVVTPNAYKEGKLYSVIPSNGNGDFTATRATTATRVNAAGLVDLVPYNLLSYSEDFSNGYWSKSNSSIASNTVTAPNGTLTADTYTGLSATSRVFSPSNVAEIGKTYTITIYAKKDSYDKIILSQDVSNAISAVFNLDTGVVESSSGIISSSITNEGNGWYRCGITYVATGLSVLYRIPTGTIFIWGAQLVEGTSARDYLRTETRLNIPRVDYSLGSCPNILVESQRTNLVFPSDTLTTQTRTVTAVAHTLSFYGTGTVTLSGVATGTLVGTGVNNRVTLTFTPTAGSLILTVVGSVTMGQLETGAYATSYIPTTSTTVTRNLDQILRNNVYTNGLITASGGTWFVDIRNNIPVVRDLSTSGIFLNTGVLSTVGNGFVLRNPGSSLSRMGIFTVVAGGLSANLHTIATDNAKVAFKWNGTTADIFVNGVKVIAATPFTPTAMENLIAEGSNRAIQVNSMALFPFPLTDTQCIALTT
jgi:hypothetical protein